MSQIVEVTLDDKGRILIPEPIRSRLGLLPGMILTVEPEPDGVRLQPHPGSSVLVEKEGILIAHGEATDDLTNIVQRERERRISDLLNRTGP